MHLHLWDKTTSLFLDVKQILFKFLRSKISLITVAYNVQLKFMMLIIKINETLEYSSIFMWLIKYFTL